MKRKINILEINNHKSYCFEEIGNYIIKSYFANEQVETYDIATNTKDLERFLTHFNLTQFEDFKGNFNYHRGDFALKNIDNKIILIDFKNYCSIMSAWKPSSYIKNEISQYTKTVDTNVKRLLNLPSFSYLLTDDSWEKTIESFDKKMEITNTQMLDLVYYLEYGVLAINPDNKLKIKEKVFIRSQERDGNLVIEKLNWEKLLENSKYTVKFHKDQYYYIGFYDENDKLVYEISMRKDLKPNCAFVNKDYIIINHNDSGLDAIDFVSIELKKLL